MNDKNINAFLSGTLTVEEVMEVRQAMAFDEELVSRIGQRKVEMLVVEELDRQHWLERIEHLETNHQKQLRIRRIVAYAAAAAVTAILFFWVALPKPLDATYTGPIAFDADHNTNLKNLTLTDVDFAPETLQGKWTAAITEQPGLELNLELEVLVGGRFNISAFYTLNRTPKTGDKITARGTYKLEAKQLTLELEEPSIRRAPGASPFETAPIELWLKTKRLFNQQAEIVGLDRKFLILKYSPREGVEWKKQ